MTKNYATIQKSFWKEEEVDQTSTVYYFAFGSNMNPTRMTSRGVKFSERQAARLENYKLTFNKKAVGNGQGYANIVPAKGKAVEGVLYTTTEAGIASLDKYEGVPTHYFKETVEVQLADGSLVEAIVYLAQPNMCAKGLKPSKEYLGHLLKGKEFLSEEYYLALAKHPTVSVIRKPAPMGYSYAVASKPGLYTVLDGLALKPAIENKLLATARKLGISSIELMNLLIEEGLDNI